MPAFRTPVGVRRWHTGRLCLVPPCVLRIHPQFCHSHALEQWYFERIFFLINLKGFKIYVFFHSQVQYISLPVLWIHPQFCHNHALDQWYFERKKIVDHSKKKIIENWLIYFFHSQVQYISLHVVWIHPKFSQSLQKAHSQAVRFQEKKLLIILLRIIYN